MSKDGRRRAGAGIEPIENVIEKIFSRGKFGDRAQLASLWGCWKEIVGEDIARHCVPEKIKEGKLYIKVDSPVWHQQLDLLKEELKEKIDTRFQMPEIERIVFRCGATH